MTTRFVRGGLAAGAVIAQLACGAQTVAAQPTPSTFGEMTGDGSCFAQPAGTPESTAPGCGAASGLGNPAGVAVSPDQRNVYAAGPGSNAVVSFARDEAGRLRPLGCISADGGDGRFGTDGFCVDGDALLGVNQVVVSPDGLFVYAIAASSNALSWFARDAETGALTQGGCLKAAPRGDRCSGSFGLWDPQDLAIAPDGRNLYVSSSVDDSVTTLTRDAETGAVAWTGCVSGSGSDGLCADGTGMDGASSLAGSPDGATIYLASGRAGALSWFDRDPATGALVQRGCLREVPVERGSCSSSEDVEGISDVLASADGNDVYVATPSTVVDFRRDPDGRLERVACVEHAEPAGDDRVAPDEEDEEEDEEEEDEGEEDAELAAAEPCGPAKALMGVNHLAGTPDGRTIVASGYALTAFAREGGGVLRQLACAESHASYRSCLASPRVEGVRSATISPDGTTMYVTSSNGVSAYTLAAAPAAVSARVTGHRRAVVRVGCPAAKRRACAVRVALGLRRPGWSAGRVRIASGRVRTVAARVPVRLWRALSGHRRVRTVVRVRDLSTRTTPARGAVRVRAR